MVEKIEKNVLTAWERVEIARNPKRKTALDYINNIFDEFITPTIVNEKKIEDVVIVAQICC